MEPNPKILGRWRAEALLAQHRALVDRYLRSQKEVNMVDCAAYQDSDLEERRQEAKRRLRDYFQVKEDDTEFRWTFSNWDEVERRNRKELPYKECPVKWLDDWANGWKDAGEREMWNRMLKEANPSDICISTNHMLMVAAIRDGADWP